MSVLRENLLPLKKYGAHFKTVFEGSGNFMFGIKSGKYKESFERIVNKRM